MTQNVKQRLIDESQLTLETYFGEFCAEYAAAIFAANKNGTLTSNRAVITLNELAKKSFGTAANACAAGYAHYMAFLIQPEVEGVLAAQMDSYWELLKEKCASAWTQESRFIMFNSTWDDYTSWRESELKRLFNTTFGEYRPNVELDKLRNATPDNWKEVFSTAEHFDLQTVIKSKSHLFTDTHRLYAEDELRRRAEWDKMQDTLRAERHAEKLSSRELKVGLAGTIIGAVLGALATYLLS